MRKLKAGAAAVTAAFAAVTAAGVALMRNEAQRTKSVRAYSDALDVSIENMSRWVFAAESVGLEGDKVADIMKDAADKIGDAWRNNAGEAKEAVESLGLDLERLAAMTPDQQLITLAAALDQVGTTAEKVQIMESIGNDLSLMLPLLENNAEGLLRMAERADELGVTITSLEAEGLREVDTAMQELDATFSAIGQTMAGQFGDEMSAFVRALNVAIPTGIEVAITGFKNFVDASKAMLDFLTLDLPAENFFDVVNEKFRENAEEVRAIMNEIAGGQGMQIEVIADGLDAESRLRQQYREEELARMARFREQQMEIVAGSEEMSLEFIMLSNRQKTAAILGEAGRQTAGLARHSRTAFEVNKAFALSTALLKLPEARASAYAFGASIGGPPLGEFMRGLATVAQLAEIQQIRSMSFGGGGGGSGGGGSGGAVVTAPLQAPSEFEQSTGPTTLAPINVYMDGAVIAGPGGVEEFRRLITEQQEIASDNDEF